MWKVESLVVSMVLWKVVHSVVYLVDCLVSSKGEQSVVNLVVLWAEN